MRRTPPEESGRAEIGPHPQTPTIALSAKWYTYPERFEWIIAHGFAAEYTPDPQALDALAEQVRPFIEADLPVRHHAFFPDHELAHEDATTAERALRLQMASLDAMCGHGEPVVTVHIGLNPRTPLDAGRAVANLTRLVDHAQELGMTVCLENLRRGPTSDPRTVLAWAQAAGAQITLDVGHAVSCERVRRGELTPLDYVELFVESLTEVHMYEQERDRHYPPQDMHILGPIVDCLLTTRCAWWTIELDDLGEALATRTLLEDYMRRDD